MDQIVRTSAAFVQRMMIVITPTAVVLGVVRKVLLGTTALQVSGVFLTTLAKTFSIFFQTSTLLHCSLNKNIFIIKLC